MQNEMVLGSFLQSSQSYFIILALSVFLCLYLESSFWNKLRGYKSMASPQSLWWLMIHMSMTGTGTYPSALGPIWTYGCWARQKLVPPIKVFSSTSQRFQEPPFPLEGAKSSVGPQPIPGCAASAVALQTGCCCWARARTVGWELPMHRPALFELSCLTAQ